VIRASRSASFSGRTSAAEADKHRPVFRGKKRHARFSACNSASSEPRRSVNTRSETQGMEAFEEMVVASRSRFLAIANAILRNREDAEDAVQNALLSGYLHLPSFEGRSALTTWFTRIVLNAALMIRRKRKSTWMSPRPETSTSDDAGWMQRIRTSQPDPETVYAKREILQFIDVILGKLAPALRQAFALTYYDEMSGPEARALLGVSTAAFKSRLLRARRQLLNQVQGIRVAHIRSATPSFADKNPFQPLAARQPEIGSLEVSLT
jgi:RNA polymerase sigma-70 factor (ECF subfamily)